MDPISISPEQMAQIEEYFRDPSPEVRILHWKKGYLSIRVALQSPDGEEILIDEGNHLFAFWLLETLQWSFAIADHPGDYPGSVSAGRKPGYVSHGTIDRLPPTKSGSEQLLLSILEAQFAIYRQEYDKRRASEYKHKGEED